MPARFCIHAHVSAIALVKILSPSFFQTYIFHFSPCEALLSFHKAFFGGWGIFQLELMQDNSLADMFLPLDGVSGQRPRGSGIWSSALVLAGVP